MVSISDFAQLLLAHDWYYDRADDSRVYQQGRSERLWLEFVSCQSDDHAALYRRARKLNRR